MTRLAMSDWMDLRNIRYADMNILLLIHTNLNYFPVV